MALVNKFKLLTRYSKYIRFKPSVKHNKLLSSCAVLRNDNSVCYPNVRTSKLKHITLISLNRPDDKNRLNVATIDDFKKAISNYEHDCSSTIAVLYGEGGSFCAGLESEELMKSSHNYNDFLHSYCQKPIIAAVSGFAYDIGFDLSLWCDMRIVEENAVMAIDRKSNIPMSKIFLKRLLTSVGYSRAMDLLLTGRDLYAKEAFECGLANRIVACGSGVGQAVNMAFNISKFPQQAINQDRIAMYELILKRL